MKKITLPSGETTTAYTLVALGVFRTLLYSLVVWTGSHVPAPVGPLVTALIIVFGGSFMEVFVLSKLVRWCGLFVPAPVPACTHPTSALVQVRQYAVQVLPGTYLPGTSIFADVETMPFIAFSEQIAMQIGYVMARGLRPGGVCGVYEIETPSSSSDNWRMVAGWQHNESVAHKVEPLATDPFAKAGYVTVAAISGAQPDSIADNKKLN